MLSLTYMMNPREVVLEQEISFFLDSPHHQIIKNLYSGDGHKKWEFS